MTALSEDFRRGFALAQMSHADQLAAMEAEIQRLRDGIREYLDGDDVETTFGHDHLEALLHNGIDMEPNP